MNDNRPDTLYQNFIRYLKHLVLMRHIKNAITIQLISKTTLLTTFSETQKNAYRRNF